jgi:hypothetical protein
MKRLLAIVVAICIFTVTNSATVDAQHVPDVPAQRKAFVLEVKKQVEKDAKTHPKNRMMVNFRDGTKAVGRIRDAHGDDFVLEQGGKKPDRTIAYSDLANAPTQITPMAEKIAEYTGLSIMFIICFPFILFLILTGQRD